jgi:hypothetical protein
MLSLEAQKVLEKGKVKGFSSENPFNEPHRLAPVIRRRDMAAVAVGNDDGKVDYLKARYPDAKINSKGVLVVKDSDGYWNVVDPKGFGSQDVFNIVGHSIEPIAATAGAALSGVPGAIGGAVAGNLIHQGVGTLAGTYKASPEERLKSAAAEGIMGGGAEALGPVGKTLGSKVINKIPLLGEVSKFVPENEVAKAVQRGRELGKVPADLVGSAAAKVMEAVHGLPEDLGKLLFSKTKGVLTPTSQRMMQKEAAALATLTEKAMKDIKKKAITIVDDAVKALPKEVQEAPIDMIKAFEPFFSALKEKATVGASVITNDEFKNINRLYKMATKGVGSDSIFAAARKAHVIKKIIDNDVRWVTGKILPKSDAAEAILKQIRGNIANQIGELNPSYTHADEAASEIFKNFKILERLGFGKEIGGEAAVGKFGKLEAARGTFEQLNSLMDKNKLGRLKDIPGRMQERINIQDISKKLDEFYPSGAFAKGAQLLMGAGALNRTAPLIGTPAAIPMALLELLKASPTFPRMLRSELKLLELGSRKGGELLKKTPKVAKDLLKQILVRQGPNIK